MITKPKRPRDTNQLAKLIVDLSIGEAEEEKPQDEGKGPAAVALGRKGEKRHKQDGKPKIRRRPIL